MNYFKYFCNWISYQWGRLPSTIEISIILSLVFVVITALVKGVLLILSTIGILDQILLVFFILLVAMTLSTYKSSLKYKHPLFVSVLKSFLMMVLAIIGIASLVVIPSMVFGDIGSPYLLALIPIILGICTYIFDIVEDPEKHFPSVKGVL